MRNIFKTYIDLVERDGEVILYEEIEDLSFEEDREVDIDGTDYIKIVTDRYESSRGYKISYMVDSGKFVVFNYEYCDSGREDWEQTPQDYRHSSKYEVDGRKLLAYYVSKGTERNVTNFIADKLGIDISTHKAKHKLMIETVRDLLDSSEIFCKTLLKHQTLQSACSMFASADKYAEIKRDCEKNVNR